jgi:ATP-binding cassette subfamily C protein
MPQRTPSVRLFRELLADIFKVVGARYGLYLGLMAATGLMEAVSLATVVPLLAAAGVGSGGLTSGRVGQVVSGLASRLGFAPTATSLGLVVIAALVVSTILFLAQAYVGATLQTTYVYRWQQRLAAAVFGARWQYFFERPNGDVINAVVTETQRLGGAFYQAGLLATGLVHSILYLGVAALLSGRTTGLVLAGSGALFLVTRPLLARAYRHGLGIATENASLQSLTGELVAGAKLVKATATEEAAVGLMTAAANRLRHHLLANAFDVQVVKGVFELGAAVIAAGILAVSQVASGRDPAVTLVVLGIFVRLMPKLTGVQHSLQSLSASLPAIELVRNLATAAEQQAERASFAPLPDGLASGSLGVSLHDVHVRYGSRAALAGVTLEVAPGDCVALVGGSGAGKSTLVDVVLGLLPCTAGTVHLNGLALHQIPLGSLRRRIGYMGQDSVLYNGSIRDNVLWAQPDASLEALRTAIRVAGAEAFVASLAAGYDTPVGDRGSRVSGGERQRLALARAALGTPGLLILDEATSALDAETERVVTDAVAALKGTTTVVIITHRLSSVRIADTICVMENGRIVEQGSWDALMQQGGRFQELWRLQRAEETSEHAEA